MHSFCRERRLGSIKEIGNAWQPAVKVHKPARMGVLAARGHLRSWRSSTISCLQWHRYQDQDRGHIWIRAIIKKAADFILDTVR